MTKLERRHASEARQVFELAAAETEQAYLMGVRHGLETAYALGGIDKAHKRQRDAALEGRAIKRAKQKQEEMTADNAPPHLDTTWNERKRGAKKRGR